MKNQKKSQNSEDHDANRRKFIKKSAKDIGACGFAIYELAKIVKEEIVQVVADDIKNVIKRQ